MTECDSCMAMPRGSTLHREWKLWKAHSFSDEWLESRPEHIKKFLLSMGESWHKGE